MAANNFLSLFTLFIIALTTMFDHCGSTYCKNLLQNLKYDKQYKCRNEISNEVICFPGTLAQRRIVPGNNKLSRRFEMLLTKSEPFAGKCPDGSQYSDEFAARSDAFLDDYYVMLLVELAFNHGTTTTTEPTTTEQTTITTTILTTPAPPVSRDKVVANSYKLNYALRDGCVITIIADPLPKNGTFAVRLLSNTPEPIPGLSETMFVMDVGEKDIELHTRLSNSTNLLRGKWFAGTNKSSIEIEIRVFDNNYTVLVDNKLLANITNVDPLWAVNYTHIYGDLKLIGKMPVNVHCEPSHSAFAPRNAPSIDWSYKLDEMKPTKINFWDLHFKLGGAIGVFLLKGCPKFDMTAIIQMAEKMFTISFTVFFIALTMFGHCKAPAAPTDPSSSTTGNASSTMERPQPTVAPTRPSNKQGCGEYMPLLPKNNRSCTDGNGMHYICYPLALSDGVIDHSIKPSRRFRISAIDPETIEATGGSCPTNAESRKFGAEFLRGPDTLLEDYHQLFMDMVEDLGWPECRMMADVTSTPEGTTDVLTPTTTVTTDATTTQTTPTTPTTMTTTTTAPTVVPVDEVANSHKFANALRNDCDITIAATLSDNGTFAIQLLHNMPEPIPGVGEAMFVIDVTTEKIRMEARFHQSEGVDSNRTEWFKNRSDDGLNVKIKVLDNEYIVSFGEYDFAALLNHDPLWAINYIYISGDLKLRMNNPINVQCPDSEEKKLTPPGRSIDWSNKLDNMIPTGLTVQDLQVKGQGSLGVYLLKGCSKFNMTVCTFAMEYKLWYNAVNGSAMDIYRYNRVDAYEMEDDNNLGYVGNVPIYGAKNYTVRIGLDNMRGVGLMVYGHAWQKADDMPEKLQKLDQYTHYYADFVQVVTEGELAVGHWQLHTVPRPMYSALSSKPEDAKLAKIPLKNWTDGDYIRLHTKHFQYDTTRHMLLNFHRGYPDWIDEEPEKETHHKQTGQLMLRMKLHRGLIEFENAFCMWSELRQKSCQVRGLKSDPEMAPGIDGSELVEDDKPLVLHIVAHKNQSNIGNVNGIRVDVFDTNKTALATYKLEEGLPYYAMEYFSVNPNQAGHLMEVPKLCKKNDKDEKCL